MLGHDHIGVARSKYNMAKLRKKEGKQGEAREMIRECEQLYSKVYGPDHEETLESMCIRN